MRVISFDKIISVLILIGAFGGSPLAGAGTACELAAARRTVVMQSMRGDTTNSLFDSVFELDSPTVSALEYARQGTARLLEIPKDSSQYQWALLEAGKLLLLARTEDGEKLTPDERILVQAYQAFVQATREQSYRLRNYMKSSFAAKIALMRQRKWRPSFEIL